MDRRGWSCLLWGWSDQQGDRVAQPRAGFGDSQEPGCAGCLSEGSVLGQLAVGCGSVSPQGMVVVAGSLSGSLGKGGCCCREFEATARVGG